MSIVSSCISFTIEDEPPEVQRECAARMMHPDAVSVLKHATNDNGWVSVNIATAVARGKGTVPRPKLDAVFNALPSAPNGDRLNRDRQYIDIVIPALPPETFHRFRLRYANSRGTSLLVQYMHCLAVEDCWAEFGGELWRASRCK